MKLCLFILYAILLILGVLAYRWQKNNSSEERTKPSKKEDKHEEKKEEKKEASHEHDDHDDHGHSKEKSEKVLSIWEKIVMWILLIPFILILVFFLIPSIFPEFWSELGGPILWEGKIFWPIIILLVLSIFIGLITDNWLYLFFIIALSLFPYLGKLIKEDKKETYINVWKINIPNVDSTLVFAGQISKDKCYIYNFPENPRITVTDCKKVRINSFGWKQNFILTGCTKPANDKEKILPPRERKSMTICPY